MIYKKGQGIEPIVVLSIAVIVLAIVGLGFYLHYSGRADFLGFLPSFRQTDKNLEDVQIVGYNFDSGSVQYYDGTEWIDLEVNKEVVLGGMKINGGQAGTDLGNFFGNIDLREGKIIKLGAKSKENLGYPPILYNSLPLFDASIWTIVQAKDDFHQIGDVEIAIVKQGDATTSTNYGNMILHLDNKLFWSKWIVEDLGTDTDLENPTYHSEEAKSVSELREVSDSEDSRKIIVGASAWRDSVFEKPLNFKYKDAGDNQKSDWFCATKKGSKFYIDLSKPVSQMERCKNSGR